MSSWLCSDIHISALAQSACVEGIAPMHQADMIWQQAKWQNLYALHCRYGDPLGVYPDDGRAQYEVPSEDIIATPEWSDVPLARTSVEAELDPCAVFDLIQCWNYQCAEFEDYDNTAISILVHALEQLLVAKHPHLFVEHDGYYETKRETLWGTTDWNDVVVASQVARAQASRDYIGPQVQIEQM